MGWGLGEQVTKQMLSKAHCHSRRKETPLKELLHCKFPGDRRKIEALCASDRTLLHPASKSPERLGIRAWLLMAPAVVFASVHGPVCTSKDRETWKVVTKIRAEPEHEQLVQHSCRCPHHPPSGLRSLQSAKGQRVSVPSVSLWLRLTTARRGSVPTESPFLEHSWHCASSPTLLQEQSEFGCGIRNRLGSSNGSSTLSSAERYKWQFGTKKPRMELRPQWLLHSLVFIHL